MKKQYVKPELYFENFQLSTSIATCGYPIKTQSDGACGLDIVGVGTLFLSDMTVCTKPIKDGDENYDKICYHQPTDTTKLFNS